MIISVISVGSANAMTVETSASSPIVSGNLRAAKKSAIGSALLLAVRSYYESTALSRGGTIPDVTENYLKYIKSYVILLNAVKDNSYNITLKIDLDTIGLNDAKQVSTPQTNTAVFSSSGIPSTIMLPSKVYDTISSILKSNSFALTEQKSFDYVSSDMNEDTALLDAFSDLNSKYYFQFRFEPSFVNLKKTDSRCELTTYTTMNAKAGKGSTFKLETSSNMTSDTSCIEEAMITAVASTLEFIRGSVIAPTATAAGITNTIKVRAINFSSMVDVNNFMNTLRNRGYISSYKTLSFMPKDVMLEVQSTMQLEDLSNKIPAINTDFKLLYHIDSDVLTIDFAKF